MINDINLHTVLDGLILCYCDSEKVKSYHFDKETVITLLRQTIELELESNVELLSLRLRSEAIEILKSENVGSEPLAINIELYCRNRGKLHIFNAHLKFSWLHNVYIDLEHATVKGDFITQELSDILEQIEQTLMLDCGFYPYNENVHQVWDIN